MCLSDSLFFVILNVFAGVCVFVVVVGCCLGLFVCCFLLLSGCVCLCVISLWLFACCAAAVGLRVVVVGACVC